MRVICISENCGWDAVPYGQSIKKGNIYTVVEECDGIGRFRWWPFTERCYQLVGFYEYSCYPCRCFIEINENEIDEMVLVNKKEEINL